MTTPSPDDAPDVRPSSEREAKESMAPLAFIPGNTDAFDGKRSLTFNELPRTMTLNEATRAQWRRL